LLQKKLYHTFSIPEEALPRRRKTKQKTKKKKKKKKDNGEPP
jgi:hypothetical protein